MQTLGVVLAQLLNFALLPLTIFFLGYDDYGKYQLSLGYIFVITAPVFAALDSYLLRSNNSFYTRNVVLVKSIYVLFTLPVTTLFGNLSVFYNLILTLTIYLLSYRDTLCIMLRIKNEDVYTVGLRVIPNIILIIQVVLIKPQTCEDLIISLFFSYLLVTVLSRKLFSFSGPRNFKLLERLPLKKCHIKRFALIAIPLFLTQGFCNLDIIILSKKFDNEQIGFYRTAFTITSILPLIVGYILNVMIGELKNAEFAKREAILNKYLILTISLSFTFFIGFEVFKILEPHLKLFIIHADVKYNLQFLVISQSLNSIGMVLLYFFASCNMDKVIITSNLLGFFVYFAMIWLSWQDTSPQLLSLIIAYTSSLSYLGVKYYKNKCLQATLSS